MPRVATSEVQWQRSLIQFMSLGDQALMSDAHVVKHTIFGNAAQGAFDYRKYSAPVPVPTFNRTWPDNRITRAPIWVSEDLRDGNQALL